MNWDYPSHLTSLTFLPINTKIKPKTRYYISDFMPQKRNLNFDDLIFTSFDDSNQKKATLSFKNGYGCNVYYRSENTNRQLPYEFELLKDGKPTVNLNIADGNIGYLSKDEISTILSEVQRL